MRGTSILVDAGPGTFARLQQVLDPADLDAVVITHRHHDHWTDLFAVKSHARFAIRRPPIPVYAPAGVEELTRPSSAGMLDWRTITDGDRAAVGELSCAFHRTDHVAETLAVRIDGAGRALGYSADTGPSWSLDRLGTDLDLLLCEATFTAEFEGTAEHLSGRQAGRQARAAGARRLVITHRRPTIDASAVSREAEAAFGGPVEQASMGKEYRV